MKTITTVEVLESTVVICVDGKRVELSFSTLAAAAGILQDHLLGLAASLNVHVNATPDGPTAPPANHET